MKTIRFIFKHWHVWSVDSGFFVSDENAKKLRQFSTIDDVVNFLYLGGAKDAARAFNAHAKGKSK